VKAFICSVLITFAGRLTDALKDAGFLALKLVIRSSRSTLKPTQHGRFATGLGACGGQEEGPNFICEEG